MRQIIAFNHVDTPPQDTSWDFPKVMKGLLLVCIISMIISLCVLVFSTLFIPRTDQVPTHRRCRCLPLLPHRRLCFRRPCPSAAPAIPLRPPSVLIATSVPTPADCRLCCRQVPFGLFYQLPVWAMLLMGASSQLFDLTAPVRRAARVYIRARTNLKSRYLCARARPGAQYP